MSQVKVSGIMTGKTKTIFDLGGIKTTKAKLDLLSVDKLKRCSRVIGEYLC